VLQPPWRSPVFEAGPRRDRARLHARFPVAGEGLGKYRMHLTAERVCVPVQQYWINNGARVISDISVFGAVTTVVAVSTDGSILAARR
jgi:hypothetical protein